MMDDLFPLAAAGIAGAMIGATIALWCADWLFRKMRRDLTVTDGECTWIVPDGTTEISIPKGNGMSVSFWPPFVPAVFRLEPVGGGGPGGGSGADTHTCCTNTESRLDDDL